MSWSEWRTAFHNALIGSAMIPSTDAGFEDVATYAINKAEMIANAAEARIASRHAAQPPRYEASRVVGMLSEDVEREPPPPPPNQLIKEGALSVPPIPPSVPFEHEVPTKQAMTLVEFEMMFARIKNDAAMAEPVAGVVVDRRRLFYEVLAMRTRVDALRRDMARVMKESSGEITPERMTQLKKLLEETAL